MTYIYYILTILLCTYAFIYNRSLVHYMSVGTLVLYHHKIFTINQSVLKTILKVMGYYLLLLIFMILTVNLYDYFIYVPPIEGGVGSPMPANLYGIERVWKHVTRIVIIPILEEIFFRRFLIGYFSDRGMNKVSLSIFSIVVFTLMHCHFGPWNIFGKFFTTYVPMSIMYTVIYLRAGLIASILLHCLWNFSVSM